MEGQESSGNVVGSSLIFVVSFVCSDKHKETQ